MQGKAKGKQSEHKYKEKPTIGSYLSIEPYQIGRMKKWRKKKKSQHWNTKTDRNDKVIFYLCVCGNLCKIYLFDIYNALTESEMVAR